MRKTLKDDMLRLVEQKFRYHGCCNQQCDLFLVQILCINLSKLASFLSQNQNLTRENNCEMFMLNINLHGKIADPT